MLTPAKTYEGVYNTFRRQIPEFYNISFDICDKWARQRSRLALIYENKKGHVVDIINEQGNPVEEGTVGEIAVKRADPAMFLEYWQNSEATRNKYMGDRLLTGDKELKKLDQHRKSNG